MPKDNSTPVSQESPRPKTSSKRNPFLYAIGVFVLALIAVTFVAGPAGFQFGGGTQEAVFGYYKGEPIVYLPDNYFGQQQQLLAEQYRANGAQDNIQTVYQIWRTAFQRTLFHRALIQQAEDVGFGVTPELVDQAMSADPRFLVNGEFDPAAYRSTPAAEILHIRNFTRDNLIHQRMLDDLRVSSYLSESEKEFIAQIGSAKRTMNFVYFGTTEFPGTEVRTYVEQNPDLFRVADLSSLTVSTEEEAEVARERIVSGELSFEQAAEEYSVDIYAADQGQRGLSYAYELEQDLGDSSAVDALFALDVGSITEPLATTNSRYVLFRLNSQVRAINLDDPDQFSQARSYVLGNESALVQDYLQAAAEEFSIAAQTQGLEGAASSYGYTVEQTVEFPVNLGSLTIFAPVKRSDGTNLDNAEYSEEFFRTAFSLSEGEVSQTLSMNNGYLVMSLASQNTAPEFEMEYIIDTALPSAIDGWTSQEIERSYLDPENIEDKFDEAFFTHVYQL